VRHIALLALARTDGRRQTGKQDQRQSDCESNCTDSPKLLLADPTVRIGLVDLDHRSWFLLLQHAARRRLTRQATPREELSILGL